MVKLSQVKMNQSAVILRIDANLHLKRRLLEFGILEGETVKVLSISPLKHTYLFALKNYTLALRKDILDGIMAEIV